MERETEEGRPLVEKLMSEYPSISAGLAPGRVADDWSWIDRRLRHGLEYLRYQHSLFDDTPMLRERSRERTPGLFVALATSSFRAEKPRRLRGSNDGAEPISSSV